jgi:hypothetical protein
MAEEWEVPPMFLGVPDITPGSSGGKLVDGDFSLDQVVIDGPWLQSRTSIITLLAKLIYFILQGFRVAL